MASISKLSSGKWRARYRDSSGKEHARHFDRKIDGQRWLDEITTSVVTGMYVNPAAGKMTFREYAEAWRAIQVHRPATVAHTESHLRNHVYPAFGDRPLSSIMPSDIQAWVKRMGVTLQPSTVGVIHGIVSGIFRAAINDRRISANPCENTKLPKTVPTQIIPPTTDQVAALVSAAPARWRAIVTLSAGTGMRSGECLGLTRDRIDFLRRTVTVDRQLVAVNGSAPMLAPPKTAASVRTIPLPNVVVEALADHVARLEVSEDGFMFTTMLGVPIRRNRFNEIWRTTTIKAGVGTVRFHDLRHYYASLLIRHGESVKTVQARLGHASAAETLDTYSHLWPDSDDRTREAIDAVLGIPADSVRTEKSS